MQGRQLLLTIRPHCLTVCWQSFRTTNRRTGLYRLEDRMYVNSSAYRRGHSCETTLIHLVEGWRHARDDKLVVNLLSTDMSKAFDSLHPPLLLSKLNAYGIESSTVRLLESYLCDRNCRVKKELDGQHLLFGVYLQTCNSLLSSKHPLSRWAWPRRR